MIFVVAEIGVNWNGDIKLLENMVINAKNSGCDAIKFQSFTIEQIKNHPEHKQIIKSSISKNNIDDINNIAKKYNIEWFCTPMYPEAVNLLEPYVKRFKVRQSDGINAVQNKNSKLLENVLGTNKEIIISSQVEPTNSSLYNKSNVKWLYCVPKYPCSFEDLDFRNLNKFDGYSNHCPKIIAPLTAGILGTEIIEIHVTANKKIQFPDNPVSFDFEEVSKLIKMLKDMEKIKK